MTNLKLTSTFCAAAFAAFCFALPARAQTGSAASGTAPATTPQSNPQALPQTPPAATPSTDPALPQTTDTSAMSTGATTAPTMRPDTGAAAGSYDQTSGNNGGGHNWGWVGLLGLFGLLGLRSHGPTTTVRTEREYEAPDVVSRP
jgi:MYXO-CTERM domain-containing protein